MTATTSRSTPAPDGAATVSKYARLVYDMIVKDLVPRAYYHNYAKELRELTDGDYVTLDAKGNYRRTHVELPAPEPPPEPMTGITARAPVSIKARLEAFAEARHSGNSSAALIALLDAHLPPLAPTVAPEDARPPRVKKRPSRGR